MEPFTQYVLCTVDPKGRRIESITGAKHAIERQAQKLNELAIIIGAQTRWEAYPYEDQSNPDCSGKRP
jgi:hypothetical protein